MNIYTTDKIRNVVLLGHGGSDAAQLLKKLDLWNARDRKVYTFSTEMCRRLSLSLTALFILYWRCGSERR